MLVSDVTVVLSTVVDSVVVVLWPQAASPTRQATADAARIDFNMRVSKERAPCRGLGTGAARLPLIATTSPQPPGSRLGFAKVNRVPSGPGPARSAGYKREPKRTEWPPT